MFRTRTERTGKQKCHRTGSAQGEGLLQSDVPSTEIQQPVAPHHRPVEPKQTFSGAKVSHGDTGIHQTGNTTRRLDSIDRPGGCISPCPNPSGLQEVYELCISGRSVEVQIPPIWISPSPMVVYHDFPGGKGISPEGGANSSSVSRRLGHKVTVQTGPPETVKMATGVVQSAGIPNKLREVGTDSSKGFQLCGVSLCNKLAQGFPNRKTNPSDPKHGPTILERRSKFGPCLDITTGLALINRETGSLGQTAYEGTAVLSKKPVVSGGAGYVKTGKVDSSSKISSVVVDAGQSSQNRLSRTLPCSTVPGFLGCLHGRLGSPYEYEPHLREMDKRTVQVPHKPVGIDCSAVSSPPLGENPPKQCSACCNGQCDRCCIYQQQGGTVSRTMCVEVMNLWIWAHKRNIHLIARHIPGKLNVLADSLSRDGQILPTEWSLSPTIFTKLCREFTTPWIDLFATRWNKKLENYVSPIPDSQAAATDALSMSWKGMWAYAFPPTTILMKVLNKIISDKCKVMLIAPAYPTANWFQVVLSLLIEEPVQLPVTRDMLKQPRAEIFHTNPEKLQLHAWILSGKQYKQKVFRKRLQNASQSQFEHLQVQCMIPNGAYSLLGVNQGKLIPSRLLYKR